MYYIKLRWCNLDHNKQNHREMLMSNLERSDTENEIGNGGDVESLFLSGSYGIFQAKKCQGGEGY